VLLTDDHALIRETMCGVITELQPNAVVCGDMHREAVSHSACAIVRQKIWGLARGVASRGSRLELFTGLDRDAMIGSAGAYARRRRSSLEWERHSGAPARALQTMPG
jgi:hypothetical protein